MRTPFAELNSQLTDPSCPVRLGIRIGFGLNRKSAEREYDIASFDLSIHEKRARITGASRRIGRGIALKLAEQSVRVCVYY
jgi:hypothetical protein